jgi:purine-nucleoside phosphorylase
MALNRTAALETVAYIKPHFPDPVSIGLLTGTGLSDSLDGIEPVCSFDYADLPHFPVSTTKGHKGRLVIGRFDEKNILIMQGRFHLYEGYRPDQVSFPVRIMQEMGVSTLIVNNAAGGINPDFQAGDIMVITDHLNLTGQNPLAGPNEDKWGIRFPDMTRVYDQQLIRMAMDSARQHNIQIHQGVYAGLLGPSLETPAEIRFLKTIGSDAVGLSTIMEVIAAVHAGMRIIGLSLITNINDPDHPARTTLESVLDTASRSMPHLNRLMKGIIRQL